MISGSEDGSATPTVLTLAASLVKLAKAVGELRQAQQAAAQAAAGRKAAEGLYAALSRSRAGAAALGIPSPARADSGRPEAGRRSAARFPRSDSVQVGRQRSRPP